jgi:hypothetical protein
VQHINSWSLLSAQKKGGIESVREKEKKREREREREIEKERGDR